MANARSLERETLMLATEIHPVEIITPKLLLSFLPSFPVGSHCEARVLTAKQGDLALLETSLDPSEAPPLHQ